MMTDKAYCPIISAWGFLSLARVLSMLGQFFVLKSSLWLWWFLHLHHPYRMINISISLWKSFLSQMYSNLKRIRRNTVSFYSEWIGSTWEGLIRVIKFCFYKFKGCSKINYFDLYTVLSDIQNAINARPLTCKCFSDQFGNYKS